MPTYTRTNLQDQVVDPIKYPNISTQITVQNVLNRSAREVMTDVDLRSAKRRTPLASKLFDNEYDYAIPADMKDRAIIDLVPQANRSVSSRLSLVDEAYFDRQKGSRSNLVTIADDEMVRLLRTNLDVIDTPVTFSGLDSTTDGGGTWTAFGNVSSLAADTTNYVQGSGSLKFNLTSGGTTAGIYNDTMTAVDLTNYVNDGSIFVWVYIVATANITNFICDIGNDLTTNYYTQTVTTTNEGSAFRAGWNLLRFDFASMTQNGTVTATAIDSFRIYMTKSSGKTGTAYRFDGISVHSGSYYDILYYSKYPWQSNAGTFLENSTAGTDLLNCDTDEFDLFVWKAKTEFFRELREYEQMKLAQVEYLSAVSRHNNRYPSERLKYEKYYYRPR